MISIRLKPRFAVALALGVAAVCLVIAFRAAVPPAHGAAPAAPASAAPGCRPEIERARGPRGRVLVG